MIIGRGIGQRYCGAAGYADDLIPLCPSSYGLRIMLTVCEKYLKLFNGTKSKILIYNKKDADFKVNAIDIPSCLRSQHAPTPHTTTTTAIQFHVISPCSQHIALC